MYLPLTSNSDILAEKTEMTGVIESEALDHISAQAHDTKITEPYIRSQILERIIWKNVLIISFLHVAFVAAMIYYCFGFPSVPPKGLSVAWVTLHGFITGMGVTAGAHRLWTHRTYKASRNMQIILMLAYCGAGMNSIFDWVRDHRVHHKFTETDADPHNAGRGFFFSHVGWLMLRRHPEYIVQARKIDMTDNLENPVIMFNKKYATWLTVIFCFVIPIAIPVIFWEELLLHAVQGCLIRYVLFLNFVWSVNSVAHLWGIRPYNRFINPADNWFVSFVTAGEGSHNYHHTFPWDYKTSEFPYFYFNLSTLVIHGMAKMGWAYDLREPSPEFIEKVTRRIDDKSQVDKAY